MHTTRGRPTFDSFAWRAFCVGLALIILYTDSLTPLGFAHGTLYLVVVMLAAPTFNERFQIGLTIACSIFTVIGIFISPPGIAMGYVLTNRALSIVEICMLCATSIFIRRQLTGQQNVNAALRRSQTIIDQQRELIEAAAGLARMGGWNMTLPDRKVSWSDYVCHSHGVHPGYEPTMQEALEFYLPEWREPILRAVQDCIENGTPFEQEAEILARDGRRRWVLARGQAVRDATGAITRIEGFCQDISAEKESQFIVVQLKNRFQQLANAVPQIIWTAEPDGSADYANKALFEYTGLGKPEGQVLRGRGWTALVHPDDLASCLAAWDRALSAQSVFTEEYRLRRHDGSYRWHVVQAHPLKDEAGRTVKWCGSATDVHDTRALAERLRNTLESITDAFVTIDGAWRFTYINGEAERLLHRSRDDLLGKYVWDEFPDARNFERYYRRALETRRTVAFEEFYTGVAKWFEVRAFPSDEGIAVYFRDVTLERQQADEMRQARERFEILARATTDAVWDWDIASDRVWWNDSMFTLFGYSRADIEPDSRFWSAHIHPDDRARVLAGAQAALDGEQSDWHAEYRFSRRDGTYAYVMDKGFIIRNGEGKAVRMVGGMVDITTNKLLQERLAQSQRLEALGQLTGGVAHDFNNLLTVIMGNAELLGEQLDNNSEAAPLVTLINQAALRAGELTRHLLAFARKQALEPEVTDIKKLINGMESLLRRTLMENFEIEFVHAGGLWHAVVDGAQLESALLNLCLNARDAMPEGGRLTIETSNAHLDENYANQHNEVQPGQYVMIAVSDTGTGIPPDTLLQVFDPFFTTKEPGKGTGLGLSMVYGFVKQSRGHVKIYTEVGQGTTVRMYLPKALEAKAPETLPVTPVLRGGNEKILLVEDDQMVSLYARHLLLDMGYQVLCASNGPDALELLGKHPDIKLLFTDVIMPGGMNGRQLADAACQLRPELKILFTSGYTENAIVHHGRLDPGVNLLTKPYQRKDLINKLRHVLGDEA